jgi:hypothetical protein
MDMLNKSNRQITGTLLGGLLLGSLIFAGLLLASASQLSGSVGVAKGGLGPLQLFELTRQVLPGGGFSANIHFMSQGLMLYFAVCLLLAAAVAVYRSSKA